MFTHEELLQLCLAIIGAIDVIVNIIDLILRERRK